VTGCGACILSGPGFGLGFDRDVMSDVFPCRDDSDSGSSNYATNDEIEKALHQHDAPDHGACVIGAYGLACDLAYSHRLRGLTGSPSDFFAVDRLMRRLIERLMVIDSWTWSDPLSS